MNKTVFAALLATSALLTTPPAVLAQKYPEKSIRLVVAFPTGAPYVIALMVADKLPSRVVLPLPEKLLAGSRVAVLASSTSRRRAVTTMLQRSGATVTVIDRPQDLAHQGLRAAAVGRGGGPRCW